MASARAFRKRAEERQRQYRSAVLEAGWWQHEHWLDDEAKRAGKNFVIPEAHAAANERAKRKGVDPERTYRNMLSSQAMCFNIFTPLAHDLELAAEVVGAVLRDVAAVHAIEFEYTPSNDVFGDQSGKGGVDCDLLIDARWKDGTSAVVTIEAKFVEPEFSICGYRKTERAARGLPICPSDVAVARDHGACLYASRRPPYGYWKQSARLRTLATESLPASGCPFSGPEWQLWVNHTLAHAEAERRGARHALFVVCAPIDNDALLGDGVLDRFRARLAQPETFQFLPLDELLRAIDSAATRRPDLRAWARALTARYGSI